MPCSRAGSARQPPIDRPRSRRGFRRPADGALGPQCARRRRPARPTPRCGRPRPGGSPGHTRIRPTQGRAGGHRRPAGDGNIRVGDRTRLQDGCLQPPGLGRTCASGTGKGRSPGHTRIRPTRGTAVQAARRVSGRHCPGRVLGRTEGRCRRQRASFLRVPDGRPSVSAHGDRRAGAPQPQAGRGVSRNCMVRSASHRRRAGASPKARCRSKESGTHANPSYTRGTRGVRDTRESVLHGAGRRSSPGHTGILPTRGRAGGAKAACGRRDQTCWRSHEAAGRLTSNHSRLGVHAPSKIGTPAETCHP